VLIVAGSDSGGGAGIQADIKTVTMLGGYATTAITAITAQNTLGVTGVMAVPADMVLQQIDAVLSDNGTDAIKIGMIGGAETAREVTQRLATMTAPIVFDPVMVATAGSRLAGQATIAAFEKLAGIAALVTPNAPELSTLAGLPIKIESDLEIAASVYARQTGTAVLAKGGHLAGDTLADLLVMPDGSKARWTSPRIDTTSTHGTGCTLASAIAVHLARGRPLEDAIGRAREFVRLAMLAAPGFGAGHGPMGHHAAASGEMNLNQVTLPVTDYDASVAFYRRLGLAQIVDLPGRYARFECPGGATLSIHLDPAPNVGGAIIYLESSELDAWVERLQEMGMDFEAGPQDQSWGWREAHLRDPTGNRLILYRAAENRRFPPGRVSGD
jgi:hydroxymethylpyrimidine/phosphomethylpyrimidine kinase